MNVEVYAQVRGEDRLVGRLYAHRRRNVEAATFAHDDSWLSSGEAYALEPQLPLGRGSFQTRVGQPIFGAFSDSAPDRWGRNIVKRNEAARARLAGETPRSLGEIDYLIGVPDDARQGTLRFRMPGDDEFLARPEAGIPPLIDLPSLLSAADKLDGESPDDETALRLLLRAGSSLGGARPKAHVIDAAGRLTIAKFPRLTQDEWDVVIWEHVALRLARRAGIRAADSGVIAVDGRNVLLLDRFDRDGERRIGYVSAMTMLEAVDGAERSYLEIADAISRFSASPSAELEELWRRVAFSILISNTDDHLRNHGLLQTGRGGWALSPAFDLNPDPGGGPKSLSLTIDFHDASASIETLIEVAPEFGVDPATRRTVLAEVEHAVSTWRSEAADAGIGPSDIERMTSAFEHDQRAIARRNAGIDA